MTTFVLIPTDSDVYDRDEPTAPIFHPRLDGIERANTIIAMAHDICVLDANDEFYFELDMLV